MLQNWAPWTPLEFPPPLLWGQGNNLTWSEAKLLPFSLGSLLKMSIWGCLMKKDFLISHSRANVCGLGKASRQIYDALPSPLPCWTLSAVRPFLFLQGPLQSQAQFIQQRRGASRLRPAAACTSRRPAAHLHAAPHGAFSYISPHSHYNTYWGWIN